MYPSLSFFSFKSFLKLSLFTLVSSLFLLTSSYAEQTTGAIRGTVFDTSGDPVSGASIQIHHIPSGSTSSTTTLKL